MLGALRLLELLPVRVEVLDDEGARAGDVRPDAMVCVRWGDRRCLFACEVRARSTPRIVEAAVAQSERAARLVGARPLVIVPFLSEERLASLDREGVSGIDLCGNAVIAAPDFRYWRSGQPNVFRESQPIRDVFAGVSSLVARSFLLRRRHESLTGLHRFVVERMPSGRLSLGTVSKVVSALEDELLVERDGRALELADGPRLMERLANRFTRSRGERVRLRTDLPPAEVWRRLRARAGSDSQFRYAATGTASAQRYGALSADAVLGVCVTDGALATDVAQATETPLFPNLELVEEAGAAPYFDSRPEGAAVWASPVQVWLELTAGGPRERQAAEVMRERLLAGEVGPS